MFSFLGKKQTLPYLEYHIVDHCNLKCDNCLHFCNYVDNEHYIDVSEIEKDLKELAKKVNIEKIRIMGGEPLLHPDIESFIKVTRENFPNSLIEVVTNGILLEKQKETFWQILRGLDITVSISLYPIMKNKIEEIKNLFEKYGVTTYGINETPIFVEQLNIEGNSDEKKSFKNCYSKNFINLWNHKLYICQNCFRIYYNQKQKTELPIPICVDLYKTSGNQIYKKLVQNPKPSIACKYCNENGKKQHHWSCSKTNDIIENKNN